MVYRDVRPGDTFMLQTVMFDKTGADDVWVILDVLTYDGEEDHSVGLLTIRYAFIHQLGCEDSISEFNVMPDSPVDGTPLFDRP